MIWFQNYVLHDLVSTMHNYMGNTLNIEFTELGADFLKAKMPVDKNTKTPFGLLHGGASCVLAETLGSCASFLCIDPDTQAAVGIEINANHLKSASDGFVIGTARPLHLGGSIHVWDIKIHNPLDKLLCVSRLTVKVLTKRSVNS